MITKHLVCSLIFITMLCVSNANAAPDTGREPFAIDITAKAIKHFRPRKPEQTTFGSLTYKGGAILDSKSPYLGGLSAMHISDQGNSLIALADSGFWLKADITRDTSGNLNGFENAFMTAVRSGYGRNFYDKYYSDSEGLAVSDNTLYASFETINKINAYTYSPGDMLMQPTPVPVPQAISEIELNQGMEALALGPKNTELDGYLLTIAERGETRKDNAQGYLVPTLGSTKTPQTFTYERRNGYAITSADFMPNGDLMLLERKISLATGLAMRLSLVKLSDIKAGELVTSQTVMEATIGHIIDNMEGLSIYQNQKGETVIALISDDNHLLIQRTIFLEFIWNAPKTR